MPPLLSRLRPRLRFPNSLRPRLVLSHLLVAVVSITLLTVYAGQVITRAARDDAEHNLESLAFAASNLIETSQKQDLAGNWIPLDTNTTAITDILLTLLQDNPAMTFTVYRNDGEPLLSNEKQPPPRADRTTAPEVWEIMRTPVNRAKGLRDNPAGEQTLYVATGVVRQNEVVAILLLSTPMQPTLDTARNSLALLLLVALLIASAVSMVGWALANTLSDPLDALTHAAAELSKGELDVRVKPAGAAEMRRLAETFNTMAARLQSYTEELRAFVANASHELRTPLTVVKLRTEALRDGALEDPQVAGQFVADIDNEVDRLVRMVNDLLDLSRIEAGLVSGQREPINLGMIASDVYETFSIRAGREDVRLELEVEPDLPLVLGNEDQLRRVLDNLIENAIKYTQSGDKIELTLRGGSNGQTVRILVKDNGPGIAPDNLPHIFERFYRVESTRPRTQQPRGSGLGLAIAKSLIESHGGKIGASSQLGKGSTFWVELPALPLDDDAA